MAKPGGRSRTNDGTTDGTQTVDITPSPRILKVIAEIDFRPWQCIAELIDNSFDEFLNIKRAGMAWDEPHLVNISLPGAKTRLEEGVIAVRDNGRGMTLDQIANAARAGSTTNDPISSLGLFGMGFNVSTAKLGGLTRFLTTREGDADWIGVEIDVDNMSEDFRAPVIREPKETPADHGTRVEISRLTPFAGWLTRPTNQSRLRDLLGEVYSYLLDREGFKLQVNTIDVTPWRHCVWDTSRTVTRDGDAISAVIDVKRDLGERAVCRVCGTWQHVKNTECERCESRDVEVRERRVHGWVGVARNLDSKQYGIDFLRNGRKILRFDKNIFQWRDPEDPGGEGEIEYPIEPPANQGRIVGEIHIDHVPVTYTKSAFDTSDRSWAQAIKLIRGEGPLLPRKAKAAGYTDQNDSPLAQLHRGFRRNDPGTNYLTAGNGKARLDTTDWVRLFHFGDPEYQTDEKWWEQVEEHERIAKALKEGKNVKVEPDLPDDPTQEFTEDGKGGDTEPLTDGEQKEAERPLTEEERVALLIEHGIAIPELNGEFSVSGVAARPAKVRSFIVRGTELHDADGRHVPVWVTGEQGGGLIAFADLDHPHFAMFDDEPEDIILMDVAQNLLTRARGASMSLSSVYAELKERHLSSHAIDPGRLISEATQLMRDIQERMVECVDENPERPWQKALGEPERHFTRERMTQALKTADIDPHIYSGDYLVYIPGSLVPRIVEEWPEAFLDKRLFKAPFKGVKEPGARRQLVATITGYLDDLAWLTSAPLEAPRQQMIRARLSLELLPEEIA
jgi:hypothetical protein